MKSMLNKGLMMLAMGLCLLPSGVQACPVCFGAPEDPITKSIGWGILFLLGVIVTVLATIAGFFVFIIKREAALNAATPVVGTEVAVGKA